MHKRRLFIFILLAGICFLVSCDNPLNPKAESIHLPVGQNLPIEGGPVQSMAWSPNGEYIVYESPTTLYEFHQYTLDGEYVDSLGFYIDEGNLDYYDNGFEKRYYDQEYFKISNNAQYAAFYRSSANRSTGTIHIVSLADQQEMQFPISTDLRDIFGNIFWSPSSRQFATVSSDYEQSILHVLNLYGEEKQIRFSMFKYFNEITWSPDENTIVLEGRKEEAYAIYILNLKDESYEELTRLENFVEVPPKWLPNSNEIFYFVDNQNRDLTLHLLNVETKSDSVLSVLSDINLITHVLESTSEHPIRFIGRAYQSDDLFLFEYDFVLDALLTQDISQYDSYENVYERYFVDDFVVERRVKGENAKLVSYSISENRIQSLTKGFQSDRSPSWHPDGNHFVFSRDNQLFEYDVTSNQVSPIGLSGPVYGTDAEYDPSGTKLVFRDGYGAITIQNLTRGYSVHIHDQEPNTSLHEPTWSSSGNQIACRAEDGALVIIDRNSWGTYHVDKTLQGVHLNIQWGPYPGAPILFHYPRAYRNSEIRAINPNTGAEYLFVGDLNNPFFCWSPDGSKIAYTQNNQIIIQDVVSDLLETDLN